MAMAGGVLLRLWNEWEIQILVLVSFALQVFLLSFAWMRRRSISRVLRILLWLMFLLAEYTATYALGHMSIGYKAGEHQQLMAFWAPFLLVHLGGQDTITAYAMEDSQLWLRHLLTFSVQALGAGYVLYKYIGSRGGPLVAPAVLMYLVGVLKNAERVWALSFSRLEIIRRYLDGVSIKQNLESYYPSDKASTQPELRDLESAGETVELDGESVLQGAHDLLYICMGQFVDDYIWPTKFQNDAMKLFHEKSKTFELVEMQLSLMYDIFYTKAAVIHTWYGRCARALSLLGTAMAFFLFHFSTDGDGNKDVYRRVDAGVTYVLILGALILEAASLLRAMGSTWTCSMLKATKWDCLHRLHVSLRRCVRIAQARRWSGSMGQLDLVASYTTDGDSPGSGKMVSFRRDGSSSRIPTGAKELVLHEIHRMVEACGGKEAVMRSYRGQCALERPAADGFFKDLTWSTSMEFDQSILAWHLATHEFLKLSKSSTSTDQEHLVAATKAVSNYMMFLFVERPYMLPSPVRPTLHLQARKVLQKGHNRWFKERESHTNTTIDEEPQSHNNTIDEEQQVLSDGGKLADQLLHKEGSGMGEPSKLMLRVVFGVWLEMLCYAAHHCSRDSHARQLNSGGELLTVVWLLTTAEFNRVYYDEDKFKERKAGSIWNFMNFVDFMDFMRHIMRSIWGFMCFVLLIVLHILCYICTCGKVNIIGAMRRIWRCLLHLEEDD